MKKLMLIAAAAAAIFTGTAATTTSANALTIIKPGCCGGWNPHPHFGGGISIGVGIVDPGYSVGYAGYASDCYYVRRNVLVPGIGVVSKRQLVCG